MQGCDVNALDTHGNTPLGLGVGSLDVVRLLLARGYRLGNAADLRKATEGGAEGVFPLLFDGASLQEDKKDDDDDEDPDLTTLLHNAARAGITDSVRALLDSGCDADARDRNLKTPLHYAAQAGRTAVMRMLLEHGCDANAKDERGRTALHAVLDSYYAFRVST